MTRPPIATPRDRIVLLWLAMIPLGFCLKFHPGPGGWLVNNRGESVPDVLLWILACFAVFPVRLAIVVLGAAAMIDVRSWRDAVRSSTTDAVHSDVDGSRHDEHP